MSEYLHPHEAASNYDLEIDRHAQPNELERALAREGIAAIEMPLSGEDFKRFSEGFGICIEECPELLQMTTQTIDSRYGGDVGYVRKEKKMSERTGMQTSDPKNYFHFSESIRDHWQSQFARGPKVLRDFLKDGFEIHDTLLGLARNNVADMENTHPNMSRLYFPDNQSYSFLRLLRYDGYEPHSKLAEVAKPHYDIGGLTIQAYADAPGFWAAKDGVDGERHFYDTAPHEAYAFFGKGHEKIYGPDDQFSPLWHGVDRIIPAGVTWVPERTAVILFLDAPEVDYHIRAEDTLPQLHRQLAATALGA